MARLWAIFARCGHTDGATGHCLIMLSVSAPRHVGPALGVIAAKWRIRLRIVW